MTDTTDLIKVHLKSHKGINYKVEKFWILFEMSPKLAQLEFECNIYCYFTEKYLCWKDWEIKAMGVFIGGWTMGDLASSDFTDGSIHWANLSLAISIATDGSGGQHVLDIFMSLFKLI